MFSCLQINCQPFYLCQLLKFHPFNWMIEIYLRTEGQGTHHKMVSLQPMPGFSPLLEVYINLEFRFKMRLNTLAIRPKGQELQWAATIESVITYNIYI